MQQKPNGTDPRGTVCYEWKAPTGVTMSWILDTTESLQRYIADHLEHSLLYERLTVQQILEHLKLGDVFFDVGANCGYFSVMASEIVGPSGAVLAFEPHPKNHETFRRNMRQRQNFMLIGAAVSDRDGTTELFCNKDSSGSHALWDVRRHEFNQATIASPLETIPVRTVTLDGFAGHHPNIIKVDTEGCEVMVMRGAEKVLGQRQLRMVVVEHVSQVWDQMCCCWSEMAEIMDRHGFKAHEENPEAIEGNVHFLR